MSNSTKLCSVFARAIRDEINSGFSDYEERRSKTKIEDMPSDTVFQGLHEVGMDFHNQMAALSAATGMGEELHGQIRDVLMEEFKIVGEDRAGITHSQQEVEAKIAKAAIGYGLISGMATAAKEHVIGQIQPEKPLEEPVYGQGFQFSSDFNEHMAEAHRIFPPVLQITETFTPDTRYSTFNAVNGFNGGIEMDPNTRDPHLMIDQMQTISRQGLSAATMLLAISGHPQDIEE